MGEEGLFWRWTSFRELWAAALRAARGKRRRGNVAQVLLFRERVLLDLQERLRDGSWRPGVARQHTIDDGKRRVISAAPFPDRIVHQALCAAIGPLLDRHLIAHTYACRVGLGTHAALRQARLWLGNYRYVLHLDVRKYFPSVDHGILLRQLEKDLRCPYTLEVCRLILEAGLQGISSHRVHFPGDDLFAPQDRAVGLPIGNLTSQHFANRYLSPVDHRAKDRLGIRAYLRYMDDMLLFCNDKQQLADWGHQLEDACWKQRLRLHPWHVRPCKDGIGWLGFRLLAPPYQALATVGGAPRASLERPSSRARLLLPSAQPREGDR